MILSVEITMYPLQDKYLPAIRAIIEKLNAYEGIEVKTFPTASILVGEYDLVMDALKEAMRWSTEKCGKAVFVTKFLPDLNVLSDRRSDSE